MSKKILLVVALACVLSACATTSSPSPMQSLSQPLTYQQPEESYSPNPGSLYSEAESTFLFSDNRARKIGDIVLVSVIENSSATNKAATNTSRDNSSEFGLQAMFGKSDLLGIPIGASLPVLQTNSKNEFTGQGDTSRDNKVTATIASRVIRVLPGNVLEIEGARETRVNNETQYLVVTGLVRASDIKADNTVMSTQMANAQIAYYGQGVVSDKQKPGWFTRLMDNIWPF